MGVMFFSCYFGVTHKFWCKKKCLAKSCENFLYPALLPEEVQLGKLFKNGPSKMFYKGCFPQILLGPFLNTLSQL